jgi:hypothetical protein
MIRSAGAPDALNPAFILILLSNNHRITAWNSGIYLLAPANATPNLPLSWSIGLLINAAASEVTAGRCLKKAIIRIPQSRF